MPPRPAEPRDDAPAWTAPYDALLRAVTHSFSLLACATPIDAPNAHVAVLRRWQAGEAATPEWRPPSLDRPALAQARRAIDRARETLGEGFGWPSLYAARLDELARELALIDAAFGPEVVAAARARWRVDDEATEADAIAAAWIEHGTRERDTDDAGEDREAIPTDDERDPRSLVACLRRAAGEARAPVRVLVRDRIGALAASGDGVVIVARGCTTSPREIARVTLHEIEGHVLPRERARGRRPGLCVLGSAGSSEDEEGRAIVLEERAGHLRGLRRRALGLRHLATTHVLSGASFVELVRLLTREHGEPLEDALRLAARTMRGGYRDGRDVRGGVARERIYLPGYLRVAAAVAREPALLARLGSSRLSIAAHAALRG
jgi:hypothetical protein